MKLGVYLRVMGPQSSPAMIAECARYADTAGLDDLWVADHIAIPSDQSEGSGGRYLDPLASLAFVAGVTRRIALGTGVIVLPYRPPLATAKWVATVQELSGGRLMFGVGVGWMREEFQVLGVDRSRRGAITDETLAYINRCFAADEMQANGQSFLFLPRPVRPPVIVGGALKYALPRIVAHGEGWMPIRISTEELRPQIETLRAAMADAARPPPEVVQLTALALEDPPRARDQLEALAQAGVTRVVHAWRYADVADFARVVDLLCGDLNRTDGSASNPSMPA